MNLFGFDKPLPSVWTLSKPAPKTLAELKMMAFSGAIREKIKWYIKIISKDIRQKWKAEARQQGLSKEAISYVMKELKDYYVRLQDGPVGVSAVDGVFQADELISNDIKEALTSYVHILECDPRSEKVWHPGSKNTVLDLVHPSLYCYVAGKSKLQLANMDQRADWSAFVHSGVLISNPYVNDIDLKDKNSFSNKFQWLPSEFQVDPEGKVTIMSYINNLHPIKYKDMYIIIERIFEKFIPLFNKVLTVLLNPRANRCQSKICYSNGRSHPITDDRYYTDDEYSEHYMRHLPLPTEIPRFAGVPPFAPVVDIKGRKFQVIVKMANIILTPENSEYEGGVWHVEGMKNERIVATGIYYYDNDNITESVLSFRQAVNPPYYEQDDHKGVRTIFGLKDNEPLNQNIGHVVTLTDRCIAFPNAYQHKVSSFKLLDPTRSGHRKILVFFLVDPSTQILSTAQVPPQQTEWYRLSLYQLRWHAQLAMLPAEILYKILQYLQGPMPHEEALKYLTELMAERKYMTNQTTQQVFERPFSLCEH